MARITTNDWEVARTRPVPYRLETPDRVPSRRWSTPDMSEAPREDDIRLAAWVTLLALLAILTTLTVMARL